MTQLVKAASNVNRTTLLPRATNNMISVAAGATIDSDIADFRSMIVGSFQVWWQNTNSVDSTFEVYVSNYPDPASFGKYPDSFVSMDADCSALLWNINVLGFRYGFVRYTRGVTLTTGDIEIIALGKR